MPLSRWVVNFKHGKNKITYSVWFYLFLTFSNHCLDCYIIMCIVCHTDSKLIMDSTWIHLAKPSSVSMITMWGNSHLREERDTSSKILFFLLLLKYRYQVPASRMTWKNTSLNRISLWNPLVLWHLTGDHGGKQYSLIKLRHPKWYSYGKFLLAGGSAKENWEGSQRPASKLVLPVQRVQGSQQYQGQGHPVAGLLQAAHIFAP